MVTMPSQADFDSELVAGRAGETVGEICNKYFATREDVSVEDRMRVLRFLENVCLGTAAVGYRTESLHGAGSPQAQRIMEPNFNANDYLFISKMSYKMHDIKRGDVIVFHSDLLTETGQKKLLIKRVIGLPGDQIDINNGKLYINGKLQHESYIKEQYTSGSIDGLVVPKGKLFCMGDNRRVSIDSRYEEVGCVSESKVVGKVVFRLYPFNKIGVIHNPHDK